MRSRARVVQGINLYCYQQCKAKKPAAMGICFGLVKPHQHGMASFGFPHDNHQIMKNNRVLGCGLKLQSQCDRKIDR